VQNHDRPKLTLSGPVLYLARHGETDFNMKRIFQGRSDIPLNEKGLNQARALKKLLETVPLTRAYVSPLNRAMTTASIVLEGRDIVPVVEGRLIEIDFGAWEAVPEVEVKERWVDDYLDYRTDMSRFRPQSGESAREAQIRAGEWWDEILEKFKSPDEHILVVAHQSLNAILACHVAGIGLEKAWEIFKSRPGEVIRIVPAPLAMISRLSPEYEG
jgi:broad specificity phosphatase PhoE